MFLLPIENTMTKKLKIEASFDEDDLEDILENIEEIKILMDELKDLRERQYERTQLDNTAIERPAKQKKE